MKVEGKAPERIFIRLREFGFMDSAKRYCGQINNLVKARFGPEAKLLMNKVDEGSIQVELVFPFTDNEINLIGIG